MLPRWLCLPIRTWKGDARAVAGIRADPRLSHGPVRLPGQVPLVPGVRRDYHVLDRVAAAGRQGGEMSDLHAPNRLLRQARLCIASPANPERPMSQRELAEAVNAHFQRITGRDVALDRHDISRWERGARRWPNADYRAGLRAVLGVETDAELGFYRAKRGVPVAG